MPTLSPILGGFLATQFLALSCFQGFLLTECQILFFLLPTKNLRPEISGDLDTNPEWKEAWFGVSGGFSVWLKEAAWHLWLLLQTLSTCQVLLKELFSCVCLTQLLNFLALSQYIFNTCSVSVTVLRVGNSSMSSTAKKVSYLLHLALCPQGSSM